MQRSRRLGSWPRAPAPGNATNSEQTVRGSRLRNRLCALRNRRQLVRLGGIPSQWQLGTRSCPLFGYSEQKGRIKAKKNKAWRAAESRRRLVRLGGIPSQRQLAHALHLDSTPAPGNAAERRSGSRPQNRLCAMRNRRRLVRLGGALAQLQPRWACLAVQHQG